MSGFILRIIGRAPAGHRVLLVYPGFESCRKKRGSLAVGQTHCSTAAESTISDNANSESVRMLDE